MKHLEPGKRDLHRPAGDRRRKRAATDPFLGTRPRPPTAAECALVAEWLASVGDIALAYVSRRTGDDPALFRRVVIVLKPQEGPAYILHAPAGGDGWIVLRLRPIPTQRRYRSLVNALNSIRRVLPARGQPALPSGISRPWKKPRSRCSGATNAASQSQSV